MPEVAAVEPAVGVDGAGRPARGVLPDHARPLIWTRPMVPGGHGVARGPACLTTRTSAPAGRPAEPALRGPSSGLTVIMLAASVIP
jgi:hypothetical protein